MRSAQSNAAALVAVLTLLAVLSTALVWGANAERRTALPYLAPTNTPYPTRTPVPVADVDLKVTSADPVSLNTRLLLARSYAMSLDALVLYAFGANRLTEVWKRAVVDRYHLPSWVTLLFSLIFGIGLAATNNLNWFAGNPAYEAIPALGGMIITGLVIGALSNATNALVEMVQAWKDTRATLPARDPMAAAKLAAYRDAA